MSSSGGGWRGGWNANTGSSSTSKNWNSSGKNAWSSWKNDQDDDDEAGAAQDGDDWGDWNDHDEDENEQEWDRAGQHGGNDEDWDDAGTDGREQWNDDQEQDEDMRGSYQTSALPDQGHQGATKGAGTTTFGGSSSSKGKKGEQHNSSWKGGSGYGSYGSAGSGGKTGKTSSKGKAPYNSSWTGATADSTSTAGFYTTKKGGTKDHQKGKAATEKGNKGSGGKWGAHPYGATIKAGKNVEWVNPNVRAAASASPPPEQASGPPTGAAARPPAVAAPAAAPRAGGPSLFQGAPAASARTSAAPAAAPAISGRGAATTSHPKAHPPQLSLQLAGGSGYNLNTSSSSSSSRVGHIRRCRDSVKILDCVDDSWIPDVPAHIEGISKVGLLNAKCSAAEASMRTETKQLSVFEVSRTAVDRFEGPADPDLCVKQYQRSAAERTYEAEDLRTFQALTASAEFLWNHVCEADLEVRSGEGGAERNTIFSRFADHVSMGEVYGFLRNRCRGIRVDYQTQQPLSFYDPGGLTFHEQNLRSELLFMMLLHTEDTKVSETGGELGPFMESLSQAMDPLPATYAIWLGLSEGRLCRSTMPFMTRLNLLRLAWDPSKVCAYELKLEDCLIEHPLVQWAVSAVAAFQTGDYGRFLSEFYARTDLLTAIMMSLHANFARTMVLFQMLTAFSKAKNIPESSPVGVVMEQLVLPDLGSLEFFLAHFGVAVDHELGLVRYPIKRGDEMGNHWWEVQDGDAEMQSRFDDKVASYLSKSQYPTQGEWKNHMKFPRRRDSHVWSLYEEVKRQGGTRRGIIMGEWDGDANASAAQQLGGGGARTTSAAGNTGLVAASRQLSQASSVGKRERTVALTEQRSRSEMGADREDDLVADKSGHTSSESEDDEARQGATGAGEAAGPAAASHASSGSLGKRQQEDRDDQSLPSADEMSEEQDEDHEPPPKVQPFEFPSLAEVGGRPQTSTVLAENVDGGSDDAGRQQRTTRGADAAEAAEGTAGGTTSTVAKVGAAAAVVKNPFAGLFQQPPAAGTGTAGKKSPLAGAAGGNVGAPAYSAPFFGAPTAAGGAAATSVGSSGVFSGFGAGGPFSSVGGGTTTGFFGTPSAAAPAFGAGGFFGAASAASFGTQQQAPGTFQGGSAPSAAAAARKAARRPARRFDELPEASQRRLAEMAAKNDWRRRQLCFGSWKQYLIQQREKAQTQEHQKFHGLKLLLPGSARAASKRGATATRNYTTLSSSKRRGANFPGSDHESMVRQLGRQLQKTTRGIGVISGLLMRSQALARERAERLLSGGNLGYAMDTFASGFSSQEYNLRRQMLMQDQELQVQQLPPLHRSRSPPVRGGGASGSRTPASSSRAIIMSPSPSCFSKNSPSHVGGVLAEAGANSPLLLRGRDRLHVPFPPLEEGFITHRRLVLVVPNDSENYVLGNSFRNTLTDAGNVSTHDHNRLATLAVPSSHEGAAETRYVAQTVYRNAKLTRRASAILMRKKYQAGEGGTSGLNSPAEDSGGASRIAQLLGAASGTTPTRTPTQMSSEIAQPVGKCDTVGFALPRALDPAQILLLESLPALPNSLCEQLVDLVDATEAKALRVFYVLGAANVEDLIKNDYLNCDFEDYQYMQELQEQYRDTGSCGNNNSEKMTRRSASNRDADLRRRSKSSGQGAAVPNSKPSEDILEHNERIVKLINYRLRESVHAGIKELVQKRGSSGVLYEYENKRLNIVDKMLEDDAFLDVSCCGIYEKGSTEALISPTAIVDCAFADDAYLQEEETSLFSGGGRRSSPGGGGAAGASSSGADSSSSGGDLQPGRGARGLVTGRETEGRAAAGADVVESGTLQQAWSSPLQQARASSEVFLPAGGAAATATAAHPRHLHHGAGAPPASTRDREEKKLLPRASRPPQCSPFLRQPELRRVPLRWWIVQRFQQLFFHAPQSSTSNLTHDLSGRLFFPYDVGYVKKTWQNTLQHVWLEIERMARNQQNAAFEFGKDHTFKTILRNIPIMFGHKGIQSLFDEPLEKIQLEQTLQAAFGAPNDLREYIITSAPQAEAGGGAQWGADQYMEERTTSGGGVAGNRSIGSRNLLLAGDPRRMAAGAVKRGRGAGSSLTFGVDSFDLGVPSSLPAAPPRPQPAQAAASSSSSARRVGGNHDEGTAKEKIDFRDPQSGPEAWWNQAVMKIERKISEFHVISFCEDATIGEQFWDRAAMYDHQAVRNEFLLSLRRQDPEGFGAHTSSVDALLAAIDEDMEKVNQRRAAKRAKRATVREQ